MTVTEVTNYGVTINETDAVSSWRLVYDSVALDGVLFESDGITGSQLDIELFATEQEGIDRAAVLGVTIIE